MRGHEFGAAVACYTVALVLVPPEAPWRQPNGRYDLTNKTVNSMISGRYIMIYHDISIILHR